MRDLLNELVKANKVGGVVLFARAVPEGVLCATMQTDGSKFKTHIVANQNELNEFNIELAKLTAGRQVFVENKDRYDAAFSYISCNKNKSSVISSAVEINLFSSEETVFSQDASCLLHAFMKHICVLSGSARKLTDAVH